MLYCNQIEGVLYRRISTFTIIAGEGSQFCLVGKNDLPGRTTEREIEDFCRMSYVAKRGKEIY